MNNPISAPTNPQRTQLTKFNYHSHPTSLPLEELLQSKFHIKSFEVSMHGRTGVFMVETNKGAIAIKSSNDGPVDQFLNQFARLLYLRVPKSECYLCSDPIFHKIMFQIQKFCSGDECQYQLIKTRLDFPFYQVMQYIPSISLAQIGKFRFQKYLLHPQRLYSLGMVIGFDMVINNSDRFRLLWRSEGNIANVLVNVPEYRLHRGKEIHDRNNTEVELGEYYFIDHSGIFLDLDLPMAAKNFQIYMEKVCEFHVQLIRSLSEERQMPEQFDKLTKQFQFYCHYSFTDFDLRKIAHGIIYVTSKFLSVHESGAIKQLYESMILEMMDGKSRGDEEGDYWGKYWNKQMQKVRISYLDQVYVKLQAIYTTYPQTLQKILQEMEDFIQRLTGQYPAQKQENRKPEMEPAFSEESNRKEESQPSLQPASEKEDSQLRESSVQEQPFNTPKERDTGEEEPSKPQKERRWRQKLAKYRQDNGPATHKHR